MSIGIIYYSRTGNTEEVAKKIEEKVKDKKVNVETIKIEHVKRPSFLMAAYAAIRQKDLPIANANFDLKKYDTLIIGSPVWVGRPAPFIKTFVNSTTNVKAKNCAIFLTCAGDRERCKKALEILSNYLKKVGIENTNNNLILRMKKGKIIEGEEEIDKFVRKLLKK